MFVIGLNEVHKHIIFNSMNLINNLKEATTIFIGELLQLFD